MVKQKLFVVGCALLLLTGCLPVPEEQARQQADMTELKLRLAEIERGLAAVRGPSFDGTPAPQKQAADLQSRMESLRVDVQSAVGRSEEVERNNARLKEEIGLLRDELQMKTHAIEERLGRLETGAPAIAPAPAAAQPAAAGHPVSGAVPPPKPAARGAEALYEVALSKIQKDGDFAGGEKAMRDFLARHSAHPLAINAMYWIGEAQYGQKKYEEAILQFQDVILQYGDHPKAAAALLKQGLAFDALGDRQSARATLQKLIDRFPLAPEADRAKAQITAWK